MPERSRKDDHHSSHHKNPHPPHPPTSKTSHLVERSAHPLPHPVASGSHCDIETHRTTPTHHPSKHEKGHHGGHGPDHTLHRPVPVHPDPKVHHPTAHHGHTKDHHITAHDRPAGAHVEDSHGSDHPPKHRSGHETSKTQGAHHEKPRHDTPHGHRDGYPSSHHGALAPSAHHGTTHEPNHRLHAPHQSHHGGENHNAHRSEKGHADRSHDSHGSHHKGRNHAHGTSGHHSAGGHHATHGGHHDTSEVHGHSHVLKESDHHEAHHDYRDAHSQTKQPKPGNTHGRHSPQNAHHRSHHGEHSEHAHEKHVHGGAPHQSQHHGESAHARNEGRGHHNDDIHAAHGKRHREPHAHGGHHAENHHSAKNASHSPHGHEKSAHGHAQQALGEHAKHAHGGHSAHGQHSPQAHGHHTKAQDHGKHLEHIAHPHHGSHEHHTSHKLPEHSSVIRVHERRHSRTVHRHTPSPGGHENHSSRARHALRSDHPSSHGPHYPDPTQTAYARNPAAYQAHAHYSPLAERYPSHRTPSPMAHHATGESHHPGHDPRGPHGRSVSHSPAQHLFHDGPSHSPPHHRSNRDFTSHPTPRDWMPHGSPPHSPAHPDDSAARFSGHAEKLLDQYGSTGQSAFDPDQESTVRPWTPQHGFSGDVEISSSSHAPSVGYDRTANHGTYENCGPSCGISSADRSQDILELEISRRKYCERTIGNIQATLLEANEEVAALTEQSRRREQLLCEKEEKIRAIRLEHCTVENFLRSSLDETSTRYRCVASEHENERAEWRCTEKAYTDKIAVTFNEKRDLKSLLSYPDAPDLEHRIKDLKDELKQVKSRLGEHESEKHRLMCSFKDAEQEMCRGMAEKQQFERSKYEQKLRMDELLNELDCMKKYGEHQDRKCRELEERLTRTESQLDNALRCKDRLEQELAEISTRKDSAACEAGRCTHTNYENKMCESDRNCDGELERLRDEIRADYEDKLARMRVEYKLKENKHEKQVERMFDKMRQYEVKLEGIVRESETESCRKPYAYKNGSCESKYSSNNHKGRRDDNSTDCTLKARRLLADEDSDSSQRFVITGTISPSPHKARTSLDLLHGNECPQRGNYWS